MDSTIQLVVLVLLLPRPTLSDVALLWVVLYAVIVATRGREPPQ